MSADELTAEFLQRLRLIEAAKAAVTPSTPPAPIVSTPTPTPGRSLTTQERIAKLLRIHAENEALRNQIAKIDEQLAAYQLLAHTRADQAAAAVLAAQKSVIVSHATESTNALSAEGLKQTHHSTQLETTPMAAVAEFNPNQPGTSGAH